MRYIAALDVGTTSVRCFVVDEKCEIRGSATEAVDLLNPAPGYFEIEPDALWRKIVMVISDAVRGARLQPSQITCMGISTQRCTFLTWDHLSGEYFHNFITWKDLRSDCLVDRWNSGLQLRAINLISYGLYLLTRSNRFLAGSVLRMMNGQVTLRLLHEIQNKPRLREALKNKRARVEFLDSWVLYKLRTGGVQEVNVSHISDITSCTATGLFDPFILDWSPVMKFLLGIDSALLPKIVANSYRNFGHLNPAQFGPEWHSCRIPIMTSISDQAAALFGSHCFQRGDVKITIGTGAFLDLVTGSDCHASLKGMYPLVAWQFHNQTTYCVEGAAHDMGTVISWAQKCRIFESVEETSRLAETVEDTGGVFFVPAFSGLGAPINDHKATSGFIGITPSTQQGHLVRALLESIAFRLVQLIETAVSETHMSPKTLRLDGGVSRNDFICQLLADASGIPVERAKNSESSVMGAVYCAGLNFGIWERFDDVVTFRSIDRIFEPRLAKQRPLRETMHQWLKAIDRFSSWYQ